MQLSVQFSSLSTSQKVDAEAGIIYGVSVITKGEALGHNLWVDDSTLSKVVELGNVSEQGIRVKLRHTKKAGEDNPVKTIIGSLRQFRQDGDHVRADLHLLKSDENTPKVLEMAVKQPKDFGLSLSCDAKKHGVEGKDFIRLETLDSVDLTEDPAANPTGLFSKHTNQPQNMDNNTPAAPTLAELQAQIADLRKAQEAVKPVDLSKINADIEAAKLELKRLTDAAADATKQAKATEIAALVAEASRDGKVVPLTDVQLSKMEVADIKEMIAKLPKAQVSLSKKAPAAPTDKDGKTLRAGTPEAMEFCRNKRAEGAEALTALMRGQLEQN